MEKDSPEIQELMQQMKLVREEVIQLKKRLSVIGREKEKLFAQKKQFSDQIKSKISTVISSKGERNTFTEEARKAKKERDILNKKISEKIREIKQMKDKYQELAKKQGIKGNPASLEKDIERLEYKIQTQPMSFDKEQKIMKEIKTLKKQFEQFKSIRAEWEKVSKKSKEIDELKKKANAYHRQVQEFAKNSQHEHEGLLEDSKEIDELKKKEEEAYKKFVEEKTKFKEINTQLKEKLKELQTIKESLEANNVALQEEEKINKEKTLKEKAKEVEEKISKRKKLTTEDLLIMQRTSN